MDQRKVEEHWRSRPPLAAPVVVQKVAKDWLRLEQYVVEALVFPAVVNALGEVVLEVLLGHAQECEEQRTPLAQRRHDMERQQVEFILVRQKVELLGTPRRAAMNRFGGAPSIDSLSRDSDSFAEEFHSPRPVWT